MREMLLLAPLIPYYSCFLPPKAESEFHIEIFIRFFFTERQTLVDQNHTTGDQPRKTIDEQFAELGLPPRPSKAVAEQPTQIVHIVSVVSLAARLQGVGRALTEALPIVKLPGKPRWSNWQQLRWEMKGLIIANLLVWGLFFGTVAWHNFFRPDQGKVQANKRSSGEQLAAASPTGTSTPRPTATATAIPTPTATLIPDTAVLGILEEYATRVGGIGFAKNPFGGIVYTSADLATPLMSAIGHVLVYNGDRVIKLELIKGQNPWDDVVKIRVVTNQLDENKDEVIGQVGYIKAWMITGQDLPPVPTATPEPTQAPTPKPRVFNAQTVVHFPGTGNASLYQSCVHGKIVGKRSVLGLKVIVSNGSWSSGPVKIDGGNQATEGHYRFCGLGSGGFGVTIRGVNMNSRNYFEVSGASNQDAEVNIYEQ